MKVKKKKSFDVKQFFVLNVEKFAVGLLVFVSVFFIYSGLTSYKPLTWLPEDLSKSSSGTRNFIDTNTRSAADEGVMVFPYDKYAEWIKYGVKLPLYETPTVWLPLLFPERIKRDKVPLLPVENLTASAGLGAVITKPIAGKTQKGERWAVVTGLIPIQKQREYYVRAYAASVRPMPEQDTPFYVSYKIERAEVVAGKEDKELEWKELPAFDEIDDRMRNIWSNVGHEPVDSAFLAPYVPLGKGSLPMACPLPPVTKPFGNDITQKGIPLVAETDAEWQRKAAEQNRRLQDEMGRQGKAAPDFRNTNPHSRNAGRADASPRAGVTNPSDVGAASPQESIPITSYLFRYLDYSVEPGKTYRYRVKLVLANPNVGLSEGDVVDFNLTKEFYLDSEMSSASNEVTIPSDSRVLVRSVTQPRASTPWQEPTANVLAVYFDLADGSEWVWGASERVTRGTTLNIPNAVTQIPSELDKPQPRTTTRTPTPEAAAKQRKVDVITNACVMDIVGGVELGKIERDSPTMRTPGKLLMLDNNGKISVRDVNVDNEEIETMRSSGTDNKNPMMRPPYMGR
ncbi:MAG: hypothetical protein LBQ66_16505 [Planctomycetaceae bacterium]|jgi:hypothetical protein|nr:hypothetical protein [Planctomycetaceae bacterium]